MRKRPAKLPNWDKGIENDIPEHDPRALNGALNHMPPGDSRRAWIIFCAKLGRLRQRAETDESAKAELARMLALFRQETSRAKPNHRKKI
jgi:hypothetical protein